MRRQRGATLIEILLTLVVGLTGLLATASLQTSLLRTSSTSKQHVEAIIAAQRWIESARAYEVLRTEAGKAAFQDIVASTEPLQIPGLSATYSLTVSVDNYRFDKPSATFVLGSTSASEPGTTTASFPAYKRINLAMDWCDASNRALSLSLSTIVAGNDPRLGPMAFRLVPSSSMSRDPGIPPAATDLGNNTSSFRVGGSLDNPTLVYNNANGAVTSIGGRVLPSGSYSVTGYISGWSNATTLPNSPLLGVGVELMLSNYPQAPDAATYGCWDDSLAPRLLNVVTYVCVLPPAQQASSQVTALLRGIIFALGSAGDSVCKYIENSNPYTGAALKRSHTNQNYIVQRGSGSCPAGTIHWQP